MIGLAVVGLMLLVIIAIEGALILAKKEDTEDTRTTRRDVYGTFSNPLADTYRRNKRGQYVPIRPNEKMIEHSGDDE